jgi:hypothetical protein
MHPRLTANAVAISIVFIAIVFFFTRYDSVLSTPTPHPPRVATRVAPPYASNSASKKESSIVTPELRAEVAACLTKTGTATSVITALENSEPHLLSQNIHIRDDNGRELRLHLDPAESTQRRTRVFSADPEGLPVPERLPAYLTGLSFTDAIERFREHGAVIYEDQRAAFANDGASAQIFRADGRTEELQIIFGSHRFQCAREKRGAGHAELFCGCQ